MFSKTTSHSVTAHLTKLFLVRASLARRILKIVFLLQSVTYHPKVRKLEKLIKDLLPFLCSDQEVQKVFQPPPMVSYRSVRRIKDYIVTSKLYPLVRNIGCGGCRNGRCQVCKNIKITNIFNSSTTQKSYKINHRFDSNDKCLIHLFSCRTCGK